MFQFLLSSRDPLEDDDEFIPFQEHATVSKYGPISRLGHTSRMKNTGPLQVTAAQVDMFTGISAPFG